jgi:2-phospho-L-lactate guanylyltransferase
MASLDPTSKRPAGLWVIVPVKPFGEGKSRLGAALTVAERADLSRAWLAHVLATVFAWGGCAGVAVVSRDRTVLDQATAAGAYPIMEAGDTLNAALEQARRWVVAAGADAVLVLPSDLPLLTVDDLAQLAAAASGTGMVIAPSHDRGTNALLLRPPAAISYTFGEDSFARHQALAAAAGVTVHVFRSATLALDVDRPEDLLLLNR